MIYKESSTLMFSDKSNLWFFQLQKKSIITHVGIIFFFIARVPIKLLQELWNKWLHNVDFGSTIWFTYLNEWTLEWHCIKTENALIKEYNKIYIQKHFKLIIQLTHSTLSNMAKYSSLNMRYIPGTYLKHVDTFKPIS